MELDVWEVEFAVCCLLLDFLSESALLAGEGCLAASRFAITLSWI